MRVKRVSEDPIVRIAGHAVQVTPKTQWVFLEIQTKSGLSGIGEASLNNRETQVLARAEAMAGALIGQSEPVLPAPNSLVDAAAVSALDQALWDIRGKRDGRRVADLLRGTRRTSIPVYANINRRTLDRSPEGFASSARDALAAGFSAFKIAPFDEAIPGENKPEFGYARPRAHRRSACCDRAGPCADGGLPLAAERGAGGNRHPRRGRAVAVPGSNVPCPRRRRCCRRCVGCAAWRMRAACGWRDANKV